MYAKDQVTLQNIAQKRRITLEQARIHAKDTPFSDVESLFSLDEDYSPQALVAMAYSTSKEDSDPNNDDDSDPEIQTIYTSQPIIGSSNQPHSHRPSTYPSWHLLQTHHNDSLVSYRSNSNNPSSQNFTYGILVAS